MNAAYLEVILQTNLNIHLITYEHQFIFKHLILLLNFQMMKYITEFDDDVFCFDPEISFWTGLVQKLKIVCLSWNLVGRLLPICWRRLRCWLFLFYTGNILIVQICSKIKIVCVNPMVMLTSTFLEQKYLFSASLVQKVQTVYLNYSLVPRLI